MHPSPQENTAVPVASEANLQGYKNLNATTHIPLLEADVDNVIELTHSANSTCPCIFQPERGKEPDNVDVQRTGYKEDTEYVTCRPIEIS